MKVLLAIKEEFASKIFEGSKKYEFRKSIFKDSRVKTIVVYVSSPVKKVIGEFEIDSVLKEQPENLWNLTKDHAGIKKDFFDEYFENRESAYAIKIKKTVKYDKPKTLFDDFNIGFAPQSYVYLDKVI
ncbi:ASCH domain-containing protein [uncultured Draconibacterium sp.]|uniref:ASCH domain-containing protein n=1 Tax=uncultured Draconibacterium sp. TaxID=1573823 RepID=UPI002AA80072|nr:ASCH domain-containing protein [uncultured Draconibacterium sp.]